MITLITTDGGYFEMAPRVWKHFGVLSGTPTEGRKTLSRMAVPLPEIVSQATAAALIEWCQTHPLSLSSNPRPTATSTPSPLDFGRPSDRERGQYCLDAPLRAYRAFWCGLTLSQMEEMLVVAKQCLIPRLQAEAELYLEEMLHQTTLAVRRHRHRRTPFAAAALAAVEAVARPVGASAVPQPQAQNRDKDKAEVDLHVHVLPEWYRQILSDTSGMPTPEWDALSAMRFMADYDIKRSVVSVSTPGALVYLQDEKKTVAIARLLNEWMAALVETYPDKFSFLAAIPLPYTDAAVREANCALDSLGAVGVGLLSSHAGKRYSGALAEVYYDNGRTLMDLTLTQTIFNFTKVHYAVSQVGGAFPSLIDRFLRSYPQFSKEAMEAYRTR
ncbi:hypothetical protein IWX90DRAFT_488857 [Phyllosticta citrichinensis]|uniref:Amidohydrolase-related domain-containing protein n=1 Tax=Phyllosticta citrichinensis TaxID=1130410 RepID=A0ABR1XKM9_9PEZI